MIHPPPAGPSPVPESETALIDPTPGRRPRVGRTRGRRAEGVLPAHSVLAFVVSATASLGVVVGTGVAPVTSLAAMAGVGTLPPPAATVPQAAPVFPVLGPAPTTADTVEAPAPTTRPTTESRVTTRPVAPVRAPVVVAPPVAPVARPVPAPPVDRPTQAPRPQPTVAPAPTEPPAPEPSEPADPPSSAPAPTGTGAPAESGTR